MDTKIIDKAKEKLCDELSAIVKKSTFNSGDLDTMNKVIVSYEKLSKVEQMEGMEGSSERRGRSYGMGEWNANGNYNSGRSYGNYSEADSYRGSYDSYDNGMSGRHYVRGHYSRSDGNDMLSKEIEKKMRDVDRDERKILEKAMEILEQ